MRSRWRGDPVLPNEAVGISCSNPFPKAADCPVAGAGSPVFNCMAEVRLCPLHKAVDVSNFLFSTYNLKCLLLINMGAMY